MSNNVNALSTISQIEDLVRKLKTQLSTPAQIPLPAAPHVTEAVVKKETPNDDLSTFEALQTALSSSKWPEAVNPHLICDPQSHNDKVERGRGIIELTIEENLKGLKVLDYGCGEGHCVSLSTDYGTQMSVGYDVVRQDSWSKFSSMQNLLFTTDFADVQARGPYDVVILFDVIDHLKESDPTSVLKQIASVLSSTGKIYMRTHPFTSRHATHLYHDLNKAYVHLVFSKDELAKLSQDSKYEETNLGATTPIATYGNYITNAGLKILKREDRKEVVEPFFKIPKISERIMKNMNVKTFPEFQLSLQFIDYVLTK